MRSHLAQSSFEFAISGKYRNLTEIKNRLRVEGFDGVDAAFKDVAFACRLRILCRKNYKEHQTRSAAGINSTYADLSWTSERADLINDLYMTQAASLSALLELHDKKSILDLLKRERP